MPPEERRLEAKVGKDGQLYLLAGLYRSQHGWNVSIPVMFSEFSQTVTTMDELVAFVEKLEVDWEGAGETKMDRDTQDNG